MSAFVCGYTDDHAPGVPMVDEGLFGPAGSQFRRFACPECGVSMSEQSLTGRAGFDPTVTVDIKTMRGDSNNHRLVLIDGKIVGEIEYVSRRCKARPGSASSTGFETHWGWRPVGSRIRNLLSTHGAALRVYERINS